MKILILSHMYPSGVEPTFGLFVHEQVKALTKHCEIAVVSPSPWAPPLMGRLRAKWQRYAAKPAQDWLDDVRVYYPRYLNPPGEQGFPVSAFFYDGAIKQFVERLRHDFDFDLIHAHAICPDGWAAARLGQRLGLPVVCTIHGADVNVYPHRTRLTDWVTRSAIKAVDHIITVSHALQEKTYRLATPKRTIRVIPNGVDLEKFTPIEKRQARAALDLSPVRPILLYASRLDPAKGLAYLLQALKIVVATHPHLLLVMIGEGEYRHQLEQQIEALGLRQNVILAGWKPHPEIAVWMSACDVVVQPSLNEGSPLPVYEALACGCPMVATAVGGIPEMITDDKYGLLVPPANVEALAEALQRALRKRWNRTTIQTYGRQYTWANVSKQLVDFYGQVLTTQVPARLVDDVRYEQV